MKVSMAIAALTLTAGLAGADVLTTYADQDQFGDATTLGSGYTATVRPDGIRAATSGSRFFNVQGSNGGSNASWGGIRFDLTDIYAALDNAAPGGWTITDVDIVVEHSNAFFTIPGGPIEVYSVSDDTTDINPYSAAGSLGHGNVLGGNRMYDGSLGTATFAGDFTFTGTDGGPSGVQDSGNIASANVLAELNNTADTLLTLVLDTDNGDVAATLKGQDSPFQGSDAPALRITYIPTPGTLALLGTAGLVGFRRRR